MINENPLFFIECFNECYVARLNSELLETLVGKIKKIHFDQENSHVSNVYLGRYGELGFVVSKYSPETAKIISYLNLPESPLSIMFSNHAGGEIENRVFGGRNFTNKIYSFPLNKTEQTGHLNIFDSYYYTFPLSDADADASNFHDLFEEKLSSIKGIIVRFDTIMDDLLEPEERSTYGRLVEKGVADLLKINARNL